MLEQVQHLGLDGDIQRGDRLVADDELWLSGEGASDRYPLSLPAGELVRVAVEMHGIQADLTQQGCGLVAAITAIGSSVVGLHHVGEHG